MPAITSGKTLVSGANGFVAVSVVQALLEEGFSVRGTVRSEAKATHLRKLFKSYGDKFEIVFVEDIVALEAQWLHQDGAFDEALKGIDAVLHLAGPITPNAGDPEEVIRPQVEGTTSIIRSALKYRDTIKRVVVLSSASAVSDPHPAGRFTRVMDESDWNDWVVEHVREKGRDAWGPHKYFAGKTLMERAAWELYESEKAKGGLGWEMVSLAPPYIYGPFLHEARVPEELTGTPRMFWENVVKGSAKGDALTKIGLEYVDIRDVARSHVLALTVPAAGGERFIVRAGPYAWQQFGKLDIARRYSDKIPEGEPPFKPEEVGYPVRFSGQKAQDVLGLQYCSVEETVKGTVEEFQRRGWL
ncbi:D-lactaldehyde dehydrogenase [Cerioporus squamosus]|nr:D-lactaldehyde dehydrogenase [Cerioporus squamosus]